MKKHLIAAAVAAAVAVPAVAQVTVSGVLDVSGVNNSKITHENSPTVTRSVKSSNTAPNNGWSTSQIVFSGTEDLGGGLKASFTVATGLSSGASPFADRDRFVQLEGGFGSVRLGAFVPAAPLGYHGYTMANLASAGSLYQVAQGQAATTADALDALRYGRVNTGAATRFERNNNNIQFSTPNFNGFSADVNFRSTSSDTSTTLGKTESTQQGIHLQYVAGPLRIGAATNDLKGEVQAINATAPIVQVVGNPAVIGGLGVAAVARSSNKQNLDWIGGQYNFGVATVGFTNIKRNGSVTDAAGVTTTVDDLSINVVGATVPLGALTLRLTGYEGKNAGAAAATDDLKLSGHQASVTYTLSKRTFAYAVMGESKSSRSGTNITTGARKETTSVLGLSHSF